MPTRIRWRNGHEEFVEDAQALAFEAQGQADIIGGFVFVQRNPPVEDKSMDAPTLHRAVTSAPRKKGL
jgi:hypothetical protein